MEERHALSLNEVESLAAKAARGAGLSWGEVEDIGRAARWLAFHAVDWADPLALLLAEDAQRIAFHHALAAADRATGAKAGDTWVTPPCAPAWALPLIAAAIHARPVAATLRIAGTAFRMTRDGASANEPAFAAWGGPLQPIGIEIASLAAAPALAFPIAAGLRRSPIAATTRATLDAFASRPCVPATARSRSSGAGGSRLDD